MANQLFAFRDAVREMMNSPSHQSEFSFGIIFEVFGSWSLRLPTPLWRDTLPSIEFSPLSWALLTEE
jgi:hypothetical protein